VFRIVDVHHPQSARPTHRVASHGLPDSDNFWNHWTVRSPKTRIWRGRRASCRSHF